MLCLAPESISPSPQLYFGSYCYHSGAQQHMNSQTYTKPTSSILEDLNELTISNALSPSSPLVEWDGPVPRKKARLPNVHRITPSENDLDLSDDELKSLGSRKPQISPVARLESIPEESEATFLLPIPRALEEDDSMDWSSTAQSVDDSTAEDVERRLKHKRSCIDLFDPQFVPRGTVSKVRFFVSRFRRRSRWFRFFQARSFAPKTYAHLLSNENYSRCNNTLVIMTFTQCTTFPRLRTAIPNSSLGKFPSFSCYLLFYQSASTHTC
jgi:hypothetical protein